MNYTLIGNITISILFIAITYIYWGSNRLDINKISQYIISLTLLGTILAIFTFLSSTNYNNLNSVSNVHNIIIHNLENSYTNLEKMFMDYYPSSIDLYRQIYDNCHYIKNINMNNLDIDINRKIMVNSHLSSIIFQQIENTIISLQNIPKNNIIYENFYNKWIKIWISWFNSSILKDEWKFKKIFYSAQTNHFIEKIIRHNEIQKKFCDKKLKQNHIKINSLR